MTYEEWLQKWGLFPTCSSGVGIGWIPILEELTSTLIKLGWDKQLEQVKEKFGCLRFYIGKGSPEMYDAIIEAEKASNITCEKCGKPGIRRSGGWIKTLCEDHK